MRGFCVLNEFINELDLSVNKTLESKGNQAEAPDENNNERSDQHLPALMQKINTKTDRR